MGCWAVLILVEFTIAWQERTGVKNREKEMLYPEKEEWSSPGGSVILKQKHKPLRNHFVPKVF